MGSSGDDIKQKLSVSSSMLGSTVDTSSGVSPMNRVEECHISYVKGVLESCPVAQYGAVGVSVGKILRDGGARIPGHYFEAIATRCRLVHILMKACVHNTDVAKAIDVTEQAVGRILHISGVITQKEQV